MPITVLRAPPPVFSDLATALHGLVPNFFCLKRFMYLPIKNFRNSRKHKLFRGIPKIHWAKQQVPKP